MTEGRCCSFYGIAARFVVWHRYSVFNDERRLTNDDTVVVAVDQLTNYTNIQEGGDLNAAG